MSKVISGMLFFCFLFNYAYSQKNWEKICDSICTVWDKTIFSTVITDNKIFVGTFVGFYYSDNNEINWIKSLDGYYPAQLHISNNGLLFTCCQSGGIYYSNDNGDNWTGTSIKGGSLSITTNDSGHIFYGSYTSVYRSKDIGNSFKKLNIDFKGNTDLWISSIAINSDGHVFIRADGDAFSFTDYGAIFRSTDNGDTWDEIYNCKEDTLFSMITDNPYLNCFVINNKDYIFIGTGQGIFRSTNNGDSWERVHYKQNLSGVSAMFDNVQGYIYAAYRDEILCSKDDGQTWESINEGFPTFKDSSRDTSVTCFGINKDNTVFAGTNVGAIYCRSELSNIGMHNRTNNNPKSYILYQNYPNPFNNSTMIEFSIPKVKEAGVVDVILDICNLLGQQVKVLYKGQLAAGNYTLKWNGQNEAGLSSASGVYIYRLQVDNRITAKRLTITK